MLKSASSMPAKLTPAQPFSCADLWSGRSHRRRQAILAEIRIVGHGPVIHETPGHRREHPAMAIAVVGRHAGMGPDHLLVLAIDLADILIERPGIDIDRRDATLDHFDQAGGDVTRLAFGLEDHAAAL